MLAHISLTISYILLQILSINAYTKIFLCAYTNLGIAKGRKVEGKKELKMTLNGVNSFLMGSIISVLQNRFTKPNYAL